MTKKVLVVDDDATIRVALRDALTSAGFDVGLAENAQEALAVIAHAPPDLIVSDIRMPDVSGLELLGLLRERSPDIAVVLMTAFDDMPTVVEAMKHGAVEFLVKPLDLDDLQKTLERVLEDRESRRRVQESTAGCAENAIVGRDPQAVSAWLNWLDMGSSMGWKAGLGSISARAAASDLLKSSWASATASSTQSAKAWKTHPEKFIQTVVASLHNCSAWTASPSCQASQPLFARAIPI